MKILSHVCVACAIAVLILVPVSRRLSSLNRAAAVQECIHMRQCVENTVGMLSRDLGTRLAAFGKAVSADRDFSMKLLVERDAWAPEVTEIAGRFMPAMGCDILDLTDNAGTVLSSGHFPARAGVSASRKAELVGAEPVCIEDDVKGQRVLTMQARVRFTAVDVPLYCYGGYVINDTFLSRLTPRRQVQVILKQGNSVYALDSISTISELKDNRILINDRKCVASSFSLPSSDAAAGSAEIIVAMDEPPALPLRHLFK